MPFRDLISRAILITLIFCNSTLSENSQDIDRLFLDEMIAIKNFEIIPKYQSVLNSTKKLNESAVNLCSNHDESFLVDARNAWIKAFTDWQNIQYLRVGSVQENFRYESIQFWPDKNTVASKQYIKLIASNDLKRTELDHIKVSSVALRGFTTIERLLFGKKSTIDSFSISENSKFKCNFLINVSKDLEIILSEIILDWQDIDEKELVKIFNNGLSNEISNEEIYHKFYFETLINNLEFIITYKLLQPYGNGEKHKIKKAESWRSELSISNINNNFKSLKRLLNLGQQRSFLDNLSLLDANQLPLRINSALDDIIDFSQELDPSINNVLSQRDDFKKLLDLVFKFNSMIENELGGVLELKKGFNAYDGD